MKSENGTHYHHGQLLACSPEFLLWYCSEHFSRGQGTILKSQERRTCDSRVEAERVSRQPASEHLTGRREHLGGDQLELPRSPCSDSPWKCDSRELRTRLPTRSPPRARDRSICTPQAPSAPGHLPTSPSLDIPESVDHPCKQLRFLRSREQPPATGRAGWCKCGRTGCAEGRRQGRGRRGARRVSRDFTSRRVLSSLSSPRRK